MNITKHNKTAVIFGATGLVGRHLLNFLLTHKAYQKVVIFTRRDLNLSHTKIEQHLINFDKPASFAHLVKGDDLFCCLGTTRAKSGKEGFYKVDFTYCFNAAKMGKDNGMNQFLLVSSVGADERSSFLYPKTKGELEEKLKKIGYWALHIFQPSFLIGERNENRFGEKIATKMAKVIDRFTRGLLTKYRPIEAEYVAKAMIHAAQGLESGIHVYPSHWLQNMAEKEEEMLRLS